MTIPFPPRFIREIAALIAGQLNGDRDAAAQRDGRKAEGNGE